MPSMFMVDDTVAVYCLTISTQVFQLIGMVRSMKKLASPISAMARFTSGTPGMIRIRMPVVAKPPMAIHLRGMDSGRRPETMEPMPPSASGSMA